MVKVLCNRHNVLFPFLKRENFYNLIIKAFLSSVNAVIGHLFRFFALFSQFFRFYVHLVNVFQVDFWGAECYTIKKQGECRYAEKISLLGWEPH